MDGSQGPSTAAPPSLKKQRNRARLSCSECRRMKLKCDRNFPCSNCRKRGCGDICPDGTLKGEGRSSRMQAEMSQLIARCQELTTIVRDLGGADLLPPPLTLEFVNTKLTPKDSDSAGRKVALKDSKGDDGEELGIEETQSPQRSRARSLIKDDIAMDEEEQDQAQGDEEEVLEGVGSLSIRDSDGRSRYLGVSAGSALYSKEDDDSPSSDEDSSISTSQVTLHHFIQFGKSSTTEIDRMRTFLPAFDEVKRLSKNYWSFLSFQFEALEESTYYSDYLIAAMTPGSNQGAKLACVFAVLSLGSLMDPRAPSTPNANALHYFQLSWATLSAARFLSQGTLVGVQTLQLAANFLLNSHDLQEGGETLWALLGAGIKILVSMGAHRDGLAWGLPPEELNLRRRVWWELNTLDRMQAFISGRPYAFSPAHCDTEMPSGAEPFHVWKWTLGSFIARVTDTAFSIIPPSYSTIVTLDEELRTLFKESPKELRSGALPKTAFTVRPTGPPALPEAKPNGASLKERMRQHTLDMIFCQIQLYLNLPAMRQGLSLYSEEPLASPWASSVAIVSLETGVYMLGLAKSWVDLHPVLTPRWWHILFHSFSASVAQASIVIKSPRSMLARHAWGQLNIAIDIFETASSGGAPVVAYVPRLKSLRDKAFSSLQNSQSVPQGLEMGQLVAEDTDAHWILGPTTRLERRTRKKDDSRASTSPLASVSSVLPFAHPSHNLPHSQTTTAAEAYTPFDSPVLPRSPAQPPQQAPFDALAALYAQHLPPQPQAPFSALSMGPFHFHTPLQPQQSGSNPAPSPPLVPQSPALQHDPAFAFTNFATSFSHPLWPPGATLGAPDASTSAPVTDQAEPSQLPIPTLDDSWMWHDFTAGRPAL